MEENRELYQLENGEWALYPYLVTCTNKGVEEQKYADDISFYQAFEVMHDDFVLNEVVVIPYSDMQIARLNEVQGMKAKNFDEIYDYVINGSIKINSEIFALKNAEKNRADIDYLSIMTGVDL